MRKHPTIKTALVAAALYGGARLVQNYIQREVTGSVKWFLDDLVANGALDYGDILDLYDIDLRSEEQKAADRDRSRADHPSNFRNYDDVVYRTETETDADESFETVPAPDIRTQLAGEGEDWTEYTDETKEAAVSAAAQHLVGSDESQVEDINFDGPIGGVPSLEEVIGQARGIELICETTPGAMDAMLKSAEDGLVELIDQVGSEIGVVNLERALLACYGERVNLLYKKHLSCEALDTLEDYLVLCRAIAIQSALHDDE